MEENEVQGRPGVDRRTLIRRSAIAGGAMVWAVPTVQTLAGPAFAAGSPCNPGTLRLTQPPAACLQVALQPTPTCCTCIANNSMQPGNPTPNPLYGAAVCYGLGQCTGTITSC